MTAERDAIRLQKVQGIAKKVLPPLITVVLLGLSLKGSVELYHARADLGSRAKQAQEIGFQLSADLALTGKCNAFQDQKTYSLTPEWRTCMIDKLPLIKSGPGIVLALMRSSDWVRSNPTDKEFLAAANATLENGWRYLQQTKSFYDSMDRYIAAMQNVPLFAFMTALDHRFSASRTMLEYQTKMLDDAEFYLNARAVADKQIERRIAFVQGHPLPVVK